jgi:hypothetical protein
LADQVLEITDGPDKPALQWAVAYPHEQQVHFATKGDGVDVQILRIDEVAEGFTFELRGILMSGVYKGRSFRGTYNVGSRSGSITLAG